MLDLEVDHQATPARVPRAQILVELQAMVKKVLDDCASDASVLPPSLASLPSWPAPGPNDTLFRSATSRYFCGQARSDSPFDARHQPLNSPSEGAILECMMTGGSHLSLKAHFVDQLPLLNPLVHTLTSLNLSYNSFKEFPVEILELRSLVFLSLRNNPLKEVPSSIQRLQSLRFLCLSFCILSSLPPGLFDLRLIVDLDVAYNNLKVIPRDICKLRILRNLNIEGNRLSGLPASALSLRISHIILGNNLMHPLLWKENTKNKLQPLVNLCCVAIEKTAADIESSLAPASVLDILRSRSCGICDQCEGSVFGCGLTVIRTVDHSHYKVRNLPFIFTVCSLRCCSLLTRKPAKFWRH